MSLPTLDFWVLHVGTCLINGMLALAVGRGLHGALRISHASRNYWLGVWAFAALPAVFALAFDWLAPASAAWSLPAPLALPAGADLGDWSGGMSAPLAAAPTVAGIRQWLEHALAALYATGVGIAALRWGRSTLGVFRIVRASCPIDPTSMPGPLVSEELRRLDDLGISLRLTCQSISPFAVCWSQRAIILPGNMVGRLSDHQLQLVIRHEAAHLAQHDPQRAAVMRLMSTLFWFNPFLRMIAARVQLAAELRCDAAAIAGDSHARHTFARAYVETLRMTGSAPTPSAAFSHSDLGNHKLRVRHMLEGDSARSIRLGLRILLAGLTLLTGSALAAVHMAATKPADEPSLVAGDANIDSASKAPRREHGRAIAVPQPHIEFAHPVARPKITGRFGDAGGPRTRPHRGMDFGAPRGTAVRAPAAGLVIAATEQYLDTPSYGTVVVLDHGAGWQTLYAHLDRFDVRVGQRVEAGEQIGRLGTTGKVTGPHLHLEVLLNGRRVDPAPLLR